MLIAGIYSNILFGSVGANPPEELNPPGPVENVKVLLPPGPPAPGKPLKPEKPPELGPPWPGAGPLFLRPSSPN